ncbi:MAG: hypothetical protein LBF63_02655 [Treponema sp.]|jgi:hypothetical protein|nr:hypothetical protein [Treponema sp.]
MKKYFLAIFAFALVLPSLWAADEFVYDTVVTETRFTHGLGFRFGYTGIQANVSYRQWIPDRGSYLSWDRTNIVTFMYPAISYQAEWEYFMLDLSGGMVFHTRGGMQSSIASMGFSIRPMVRYAAVDSQKLRYTLLLGPECLLIDGAPGLAVNLVQEIGAKINERFMPFLGLGIGYNIFYGNYGPIRRLLNSSRDFESGIDEMGLRPDLRFEITVGLKTMLLEDVFYYKGREVRRRRR